MCCEVVPSAADDLPYRTFTDFRSFIENRLIIPLYSSSSKWQTIWKKKKKKMQDGGICSWNVHDFLSVSFKGDESVFDRLNTRVKWHFLTPKGNVANRCLSCVAAGSSMTPNSGLLNSNEHVIAILAHNLLQKRILFLTSE